MMKICNKCKEEHDEAHTFCPSCGNKLTLIKSKPGPRPSAEKIPSSSIISYPFSNIGALLLNTLFMTFSSLVIPLVLVYGYMGSIIHSQLDDPRNPLPRFKGFMNIIKNGLKIFIIMILYLLIPMLLIVAALYKSNISTSWAYYNNIGLVLQLGPIGIFGLGLGIVAAFFLPFSVINYVHHQKFKEAFNLDMIVSRIGHIFLRYCGVWIGLVACLIIFKVISYYMKLILIKFTLVGFVAFLLMVNLFYVLISFAATKKFCELYSYR